MYIFSSKAKYSLSEHHKELVTSKDLCDANIAVQDDEVSVKSFKIKLREDVFNLDTYKYLWDPPASNWWSKDIGSQWEVQLNFAVHCATTALGVSTQYLNSKHTMVRSWYRFHAYYHVRRILRRIQAPLPNEHGFNKYKNHYNLEAFKRLCQEYGVSSNWYSYKNKMLFDRLGTASSGYQYFHNDWSKWIMNESEGFTKQGIEKISESIRAYTYLILSSHFAARHSIIGDNGPAVAAQRIFYDNLEDVINKEVSIQDDISRYESVLSYARSELDYSVGEKLYMLPSNMIIRDLESKVWVGFNDKIIISGSSSLGKKMRAAKPIEKKPTVIHHDQSTRKLTPKPMHDESENQISISHSSDEVHEEEKFALILGVTGMLLAGVWLFRKI